MGDALWKDYYLPCGWGRRKKEIDQKTGWIHGRSPLKGILSEHPEQALMFIKNSFQTTALTWILSLGKKAIKDCEKTEKVRAIWRKLVFIQIAEREVFSHWQKPHCVLNKNHPVIFIEGAYDRFYWMEWKRIVFSILMEGCHAVVGAWTEENGGSKLTEGFCFSSSQGFIPLQSKFFLIIIFKFSIA